MIVARLSPVIRCKPRGSTLMRRRALTALAACLAAWAVAIGLCGLVMRAVALVEAATR